MVSHGWDSALINSTASILGNGIMKRLLCHLLISVRNNTLRQGAKWMESDRPGLGVTNIGRVRFSK